MDAPTEAPIAEAVAVATASTCSESIRPNEIKVGNIDGTGVGNVREGDGVGTSEGRPVIPSRVMSTTTGSLTAKAPMSSEKESLPIFAEIDSTNWVGDPKPLSESETATLKLTSH